MQDARIYPRGGLDVLSRAEVARLRDASAGGMHELLRRCALAVLTSGSASDDPRAARDLYPRTSIFQVAADRGVRIDLINAPAMAFVDGELVRVAELLFAGRPGLHGHRAGPRMRRPRIVGGYHQRRLRPAAQRAHPEAERSQPGGLLGGHSISRDEYLYTKQVGYELGLVLPGHLHRRCGPVR